MKRPDDTHGYPTPRVPITIIGGYLGAGKTTLINRLLSEDHGLRIAVLVNDFGEINFDASLIARHNGQTVELTNGCVCCSIANDLGSALATLSSLRPRPDHVVLEASGVADPGRVANYTFGQPDLELNGVVVLADCQTVENRTQDKFVGTTVRRQLSAADTLVLTKTDLIENESLQQRRFWLQREFPNAAIHISNDASFRWDLLLGITHPQHKPRTELPASHSESFTTATWQEDIMLDRDAFLSLLQSVAGTLLRCKGWVTFAETPQTRTLVQMVGDQIELTDGEQHSADSEAGLAFIFPSESPDIQSICKKVSACQATAR